MLQKIKNAMMAFVLPVAFVVPLAVGGAAGAVALGNCDDFNESLQQGVNAAAGENASCSAGSNSGGGLTNIAKTIVNYLSVIVGIVAVIMIIVGGFRYITSGGDSGNVSSAKNTLIYAIVGLIIVALAQFIVRFVLDATATIS